MGSLQGLLVLNINIDPYILHLGKFSISWHGTLMAAGALLIYIICISEGKKQGFKRAELDMLAVWLIIGGSIGARTVKVVAYPQFFLSHPISIFIPQDKGTSSTGAVLGSVLTLWLYARYHKLQFRTLADLLALACPAGIFVGRIGCLIMGDATGIPTRNWGLVYWHTNSAVPVELIGRPIFPAPLFLAISAITLLFLLLWLRRKVHHAGVISAVFLLGYAIIRFVINFWQIDPQVFLRLKYIQWVALVIFLTGCIVFLGSYLPKYRTSPVEN